MAENENKELATVEQTYDDLRVSTLDTSNPKAALKVVSLMANSQSFYSWNVQHPNQVFSLQDVVMERGVRKDKDSGNYVSCINTTIITGDGECLMSQSGSLARSVQRIIEACPSLRVDDKPIPVRAAQRVTNGRTYSVIVPALD